MDQCQILMGYFSLHFYQIAFKPWVLTFYAMTFFRIHSCSSGFIQDFLDHYADRCRFNDVHVGCSRIHGMNRLKWGSVSKLGRPINPLNARFYD